MTTMSNILETLGAIILFLVIVYLLGLPPDPSICEPGAFLGGCS